ncbi:GDSL esterase/lipase At5g45960-like [Camellia sinensis]|uniref:GDSL esterase/lipase At5g45960-like n=1 Tax=Camellia sinensis TaxID=4442 RepID=UPI0010357549|nr:GDSL esterase/lipase At5g45960-like [Camellia sinensis]
MSPYKHSLLCLFVVFFVSKAQDEPPRTLKYLFRSVYSFGDSFVDPGNNNYLPNVAKSNFPPYGRDFVNKQPTGRFSNGKLFPDFVAIYLGSEYQRPYMDPMLNLTEQPTAVSFASATSGYDPSTTNKSNATSMLDQLEEFKVYKGKLQRKLGKRIANREIRRALFYVNAGSDDFALSYFGDGNPTTTSSGSIPQKITPEEYEQSLLKRVKQFVQGLWYQGARKIAVNGLPPLGCIPIGITRLPPTPGNSQDARNCVEYVNAISKDFNLLLQDELKALQNKFPKFGTKIAYIDFEQPLLDIIQNPDEYDFSEVNKGCCGTGLYEIGVQCNETTPVCADASEYVFWDAAHPSEDAYYAIFQSNLATIDQIIKF